MKYTNPEKVKLLASIFLFFLLPTVGSAETGKAPDPGAVKRGAIIYKKHCVTCHGEKAAGVPVPPPLLRQPGFIAAPALNGSAHAWHHSDEDLLKVIMEGSKRPNTMPGWKGVLTIEQARDVIGYFKSFWNKRLLDCQGPKHMSCM